MQEKCKTSWPQNLKGQTQVSVKSLLVLPMTELHTEQGCANHRLKDISLERSMHPTWPGYSNIFPIQLMIIMVCWASQEQPDQRLIPNVVFPITFLKTPALPSFMQLNRRKTIAKNTLSFHKSPDWMDSGDVSDELGNTILIQLVFRRCPSILYYFVLKFEVQFKATAESQLSSVY